MKIENVKELIEGSRDTGFNVPFSYFIDPLHIVWIYVKLQAATVKYEVNTIHESALTFFMPVVPFYTT